MPFVQYVDYENGDDQAGGGYDDALYTGGWLGFHNSGAPLVPMPASLYPVTSGTGAKVRITGALYANMPVGVLAYVSFNPSSPYTSGRYAIVASGANYFEINMAWSADTTAKAVVGGALKTLAAAVPLAVSTIVPSSSVQPHRVLVAPGVHPITEGAVTTYGYGVCFPSSGANPIHMALEGVARATGALLPLNDDTDWPVFTQSGAFAINDPQHTLILLQGNGNGSNLFWFRGRRLAFDGASLTGEQGGAACGLRFCGPSNRYCDCYLEGLRFQNFYNTQGNPLMMAAAGSGSWTDIKLVNCWRGARHHKFDGAVRRYRFVSPPSPKHVLTTGFMTFSGATVTLLDSYIEGAGFGVGSDQRYQDQGHMNLKGTVIADCEYGINHYYQAGYGMMRTPVVTGGVFYNCDAVWYHNPASGTEFGEYTFENCISYLNPASAKYEFCGNSGSNIPVGRTTVHARNCAFTRPLAGAITRLEPNRITPGLDRGNIVLTGDPFVNAAAGDFRLDPNSPDYVPLRLDPAGPQFRELVESVAVVAVDPTGMAGGPGGDGRSRYLDG